MPFTFVFYIDDGLTLVNQFCIICMKIKRLSRFTSSLKREDWVLCEEINEMVFNHPGNPDICRIRDDIPFFCIPDKFILRP